MPGAMPQASLLRGPSGNWRWALCSSSLSHAASVKVVTPAGLSGPAVHVWQVDLAAAPAGIVPRDDELRRVAGMLDEGRAAHVLASRAWLRVILGRYLDLDAADVQLSRSTRGKPSIVDGGDLCVSLSRSAGLALIALTRGRPVGVDLERIRADVDHERLSQRFFAPGEVEAVRRLPVAHRLDAFFGLWARKEAVVKASGAGLSEGLDHLDVCGSPVAGRWSVASLDSIPGFAAAVAVDGALGPVSLHEPDS